MLSSFYLVLLTLFLSSLLYYALSKPKSHHLPLPPGPRGYPIVGNFPQLGPKLHQALHSLSRIYGPLLHIRLGQIPVIVASSPSYASLLLKTHDANFCNRPYTSGAKYLAFDAHDIVFGPYGPRWRLLRKIGNTHMFSVKALDSSSHIRHESTKALVTGLGSAHGEAVEMGPWVNGCASNTLGLTLVGKRLFGGTAEERGEARELMEIARELMKVMGEFVIGDFLPWLNWMDLGGVVGRMKRLRARFDAYLDRLIKEHEGQDVDGLDQDKDRDMLSVLLSLKDNDDPESEKVSDLEINAFLGNMLIAGTDTSASTVEWALAELIRHPNLLKQAQEELDSIVGRDRLVFESDIPNLPFLQAIVKETFRLHPPTPLLLPRITSESIDINGYHIPKNSTLLINAWALGRDPESWADHPLEFRPARFLPGGAHELADVKGNDFEIIPFGAGRRICVGLNMGLRMVQLMTATLIHAFDWALPLGQMPEMLDMEEAYGLTLQRAVPLVACPKPRLSLQLYGPSTN